jgi:hypothetical protein
MQAMAFPNAPSSVLGQLAGYEQSVRHSLEKSLEMAEGFRYYRSSPP